MPEFGFFQRHQRWRGRAAVDGRIDLSRFDQKSGDHFDHVTARGFELAEWHSLHLPVDAGFQARSEQLVVFILSSSSSSDVGKIPIPIAGKTNRPNSTFPR